MLTRSRSGQRSTVLLAGSASPPSILFRRALVDGTGGLVARGDDEGSPTGSGKREEARASVGDGLPDQLGHLNDQIRSGLTWIARCANLADADADHVVQPAVGLAVGQVKHRPDDLAAFLRVGTAIPMPLNHDRGPVVGLDDSPEVWPEGAGRALLPGEVRAAEPPGDPPLTASLGDEEHLLPAAVKADRPASG